MAKAWWARRPLMLTEVDALVCLLLMLVGMSLAPLERVVDASSSPRSRAMAMLGAQVLMMLPPVAWLYWRGVRSGLGGGIVAMHRPLMRDGVWAAAGLLVALPLVMGVMQASIWLGERAGYPAPAHGHETLRMLREEGGGAAWGFIVIAAIVVAPVGEELIYRGLLQSVLLRVMRERRRVAAIGVASLLFAMIHSSSAPWQALPGLFVLGVMLGLMLERTGRLMPCILLHALFNAANLTLTAWSLDP